MMLRGYLWKEWREQRWALVAVFVSLAVLSMGARVFLAWEDLRATSSVVLAAVEVALLLGLVLVVGELMPGEARRGHADFLRRLPGGVWTPIAAKALLATAVLGVCALAGLLCACLLQGFAEFQYHLIGHASDLRDHMLIALGLCAWCLAVSAWLPRGTFTLPGTILFWLVCVQPAVLLVARSPGLGEALWQSLDRQVLQWLLLASGVPLAGVAMARALRWRRDPWGWAGPVTLAVAAFVPLWGWAALRAWQWRVADPAAAGFRIARGFLGNGGRFAFLDTETSGLLGFDPRVRNHIRWPHHTLVVDLLTGAWRQVGGPGSVVMSPMALANQGHAFGGDQPQDWLVCGAWTASDGEHLVLDGRTGAELGPLALDRLPLDAHRSGTPFRFPDTRRAWLEGNQLMVAASDGRPEALPWTPSDVALQVAGLGLVLSRRQANDNFSIWVYDLTRRRAFRVPKETNTPVTVVARPGRWALRRAGGVGRNTLSWFDPETGQESGIEAFPRGALLGLMADGRLLLSDEQPDVPRLVLLDPDTGVRTPVAFADEPGGFPTMIRWIASTPAGEPILQCDAWQGRESRSWFAVVRDGVARSTAVFHNWAPHFVSAPDQDSAITIVADQALERVWWDSRRRERLWPRVR